MLLLGFPESLTPARQLAHSLNCAFAEISIHHFPDGESLVTLPEKLDKTVIFFRSLNQPNEKLVELLIALESARRNGSKRIILVTPYLCYMRQDMAFKPGQAISQRIIGDLLSEWVDDLITIDPHLHRIQHLNTALPYCASIAATAAPLLGEFLLHADVKGVLVGPDAESQQWVEQVAQSSGLDFVIASKERAGDRDVSVELPACNYQARHAILVDDVISSGHTMIEAAKQLFAAGVSSVSALCTHALFAPGAESGMQAAGIHNIWSSDSIEHPTNRIPLTTILAAAVKKTLGEQT